MKVLTVIGARPQFIKAAPISKALSKQGIFEYLVHTGQHYDYDMSQLFFEELDLPQANVNLGVGSGSHAHQTGEMLIRIESILLAENPDLVLVYGDTNSTLAGALAAAKLNVKIAHVEAGLRSNNRKMPEEINRILTDHCANLLFCPTQRAVDNLAGEGILNGVFLTGDTMYDSLVQFVGKAEKTSKILQALNVEPKKYLLATIHRASNTDSREKLLNIITALEKSGEEVILPLHPRTRAALESLNIQMDDFPKIRIIDPVGYLDILWLESNARMILTDSGGIQKEAYWLKVPCITLREDTEWVETIQSGWNVLSGSDVEPILRLIKSFKVPDTSFSTGNISSAADRIVEILAKEMSE